MYFVQEFINFHDKKQSAEYSQNCKSKNAKILGFIWMSASEILFVTDQGVELYQVGKPGACRMKYKISLLCKPGLFTFKKGGRPLFIFSFACLQRLRACTKN